MRARRVLVAVGFCFRCLFRPGDKVAKRLPRGCARLTKDLGGDTAVGVDDLEDSNDIEDEDDLEWNESLV